jgi:hypothetical protein
MKKDDEFKLLAACLCPTVPSEILNSGAEEKAIARQRFDKHVPAATNTNPTVG